MRTSLVIALAATLILAAGIVAGQEPGRPAKAAEVPFVYVQAGTGPGSHSIDVQRLVVAGGAPGAQVLFDKLIALDYSEGVVKDAPFSAEAANETVQTLADGNRIVHTDTTLLWRDSEGRTRREMTIGVMEAVPGAKLSRRTVFINDPVADARYVLDPETRTVFQTPAQGQAAVTLRREGPSGEEAMRQGLVIEQRVVTSPNSPQRAAESLGKRTIEGLETEGTRSVFTIPAGEIGNERPIEIVSERWYSPRLRTAVLSIHNDPRFGQTTYRLTNIVLTEPDRSLFQAPADYRVKQEPARIDVQNK
jgi:hypothetical protein